MLKRTLSQERAEAERTKESLEKLMAEIVLLRERLAVKAEGDRIQNGVLIGSAQASKTFGHVLTQVTFAPYCGLYYPSFSSQKLTQVCFSLCSQIQFLKRRLHALNQLMQAYEETDSVDITLLDETDWDHGVAGNGAAVQTCEEYAACLSGDVSEAAQSLAELQQAMEDVCARLMGSSCALQ
ncbi:hypothetical protein BBJ28_00021679 [Nothophytophthora sp. Chile5]|nr:hypothetical protein BBJ28_00021679 [Nothophytophthora sp. Chile5]